MAENNWLEGRHALVTGGGTGIGASAAAHLHAAGAKVTLLGRRMEPLQQTAERIGGYAVSCDVTQPGQIAKAFDEARTLNGPIELLVVNAGIAESAPFHKMTRESWDRIIAVNLRGTIGVTRAVLDGMIDRSRGRIIHIASDAGRVGSSQEAVYSACKGGIIAFTKTVAREVARKGITLNTVCPGPTDTPLLAAVAGADERGQKIRAALVSAIPMKRVGQPDDIPGAVCFLASDDAAFITGQTISVSGGLTMHG